MVLFPTVGAPDDYVKKRLKMTKEDAPGYPELLSKAKVIGVWDDHDYGQNDSGRDFEMKD